MHATVQKTFTIAGLALAALPIIVAGMANAEPAKVRISDLDLSRPAHAAAFNQRIEQAADRLCNGVRDIAITASCRAAVREEAFEKLSAARSQATADQARKMILASR